MARIEIADRGPGLSAEAGRRLYEPYFTTKSEGTGLGMALTNRIIIEHGGLVTAENRTGGGARVSIFLPLRAAEVDLNVVATADASIVEVQGTAEGDPIPKEKFDAMLELALAGTAKLQEEQRRALARADIEWERLLGG